MSDLACIWTKHADTRLGERFGSKSVKVKQRLEEMIAREEYTVIEDNQPGPDKIAIRMHFQDNPIEIVLALSRGRPVIVTVLPRFVARERRKNWWKK